MAQGDLKDYAYITVGVLAVFGLLFAYSGVWPPIVVVETNSMMHVDRTEVFSGQGSTRAEDTSWGRLGTMDPGDIILLKQVDSLEEISVFANAGEDHYKMAGDVVAYKRPANEDPRPIIHRAMTYVEVQGSGPSTTYRVLWSETWEEQGDCVSRPVYTCVFNATGVTIREIGVVEKAFAHSGFITKGDNPVTNAGADQAGSDPLNPEPVRLEDIVGKAQAEIPAMGVLKPAFSGDSIKNADMAPHAYYLQIGNMVAPVDIWGLMLLEITLLSLSPLFAAIWRDFRTEPTRKVAGELSVLKRAWEETASRRRAWEHQKRVSKGREPGA